MAQARSCPEPRVAISQASPSHHCSTPDGSGYQPREEKRVPRLRQLQCSCAVQHVGYYSPTLRLVRNTAKGRFPSFLGLFGKK